MNIKQIIQKFVQNKMEFSEDENNLDEIIKEFDFSKVEHKLGFNIHPELKDYFNSYHFDVIEGIIFPSQIKPTDKWGNWFEFEGQHKNIFVTLDGIENKDINIERFIEIGFIEWTGGYDFGRRFHIGSLFDNRGDILLVFNNDTGNIEWIDCEWGCYGDLEKDPNGILAESISELVLLLNNNMILL
jgi:hypothetical protein